MEERWEENLMCVDMGLLNFYYREFARCKCDDEYLWSG